MTTTARGRLVGPATKGLRLTAETPVADVVAGGPHVTDPRFGWPLLTLDDAALEHNVTTMARTCAARGVFHAPHVKTAMSAGLHARQQCAGAWGATVATAAQLRVVRAWGVRRVVVANEVVDPRDWAWITADLAAARRAGAPAQLLTWVDSEAGIEVAARALDRVDGAVRHDLGFLVELGVAGGRTGRRTVRDAVALGARAAAAGLPLVGAAGYEGSAAAGTSPAELDRVRAYCRDLVRVGDALVADGLVDGVPVLSAGGSTFLDVVLDELTALHGWSSPTAPRVVVRSGAYVTHDHGLCARSDPWARLPRPAALRPAATVWCQVLSTPEPGLAVCGAGRRDVPYDIDLPTVLSVRRQQGEGWGAAEPLGGWTVVKVDDQHLYTRGEGAPPLAVGDVLGLGISHPCTLFDKWRAAVVVDGDDRAVDIYLTEF